MRGMDCLCPICETSKIAVEAFGQSIAYCGRCGYYQFDSQSVPVIPVGACEVVEIAIKQQNSQGIVPKLDMGFVRAAVQSRK
jgi:hypothetical protein